MPPSSERCELLDQLSATIDRHLESLPGLAVSPQLDAAKIRAHLERYDFSAPRPATEVLEDCASMLTDWSLQSTHPRYFGLFNPTATFAGVLADALVAVFNPQLGAWHHSPAGAEIEQHLIRRMGALFGWPSGETSGIFTSGGTEANATAVSVALARSFPSLLEQGMRSLAGQPVMYASDQAHHSLQRVAEQSGLGRAGLQSVTTTPELRMDPQQLARRIHADRAAGRLPFLVVATAGTTSAGIIDPIGEIADVCAASDLPLHVDAAWGGAAALSRQLRPFLAGIERADSITFDPHKWLSVPMGCGMYLCRDSWQLQSAFRMDTDYVPSSGTDLFDAFQHGPQWSRRFLGLKVFMSLATAGLEGYERSIDHQVRMAEELRELLQRAAWRVVNDTPLPLVCFVDPVLDELEDSVGALRHHREIARQVVESGGAWISTARLAGRPVLRACITSFLTQEGDLRALVAALKEARSRIAVGAC